MPRAPVISLSHGGGPLPLLNHPSQTALTHSLRTRVRSLLHLSTPLSRPRAIVVITAHWETPTPTISCAASHPLYYDYHGFPASTYSLKYDCPGSPEVAKEVFDVFETAGLKPALDAERGWDHGVFVPFLLINPEADVPLIQLSVPPAGNDEDSSTTTLYAMGRALSQLRDRNIAIVGSGLATVHNMRLLRAEASKKDPRKEVEAFSAALSEAMAVEGADQREEALRRWRDFPGAEAAHMKGRAEHLFPLVVCAGAGGEAGAKNWVDEAMGWDLVSYYWE